MLESGRSPFPYTATPFTNINCRPKNKEELFNLRHASARNVIERIFGVLKHRFRILLLPPSYSMAIQARIPAALCALHNFINENDLNQDINEGDVDDPYGYDPECGVTGQGAQLEESGMDVRRDRIATDMWDDYQRRIAERIFDGEMSSDESSGSEDDI